jgi:hypothetical protein
MKAWRTPQRILPVEEIPRIGNSKPNDAICGRVL